MARTCSPVSSGTYLSKAMVTVEPVASGLCGAPPPMGAIVPPAPDGDVLVPLLLLLATTVDVEDDRLFLDLNVGDDDAIAGLGSESMFRHQSAPPRDRWE